MSRITRKTFLGRAGAAGVSILGGTLWATGAAAAAARRSFAVDSPIDPDISDLLDVFTF